MLITGPTVIVSISVEVVTKRLSDVYSAEAKSWQPEYKDNRDVLAFVSRWLVTHNID
jgi:hypothetical protein